MIKRVFVYMFVDKNINVYVVHMYTHTKLLVIVLCWGIVSVTQRKVGAFVCKGCIPAAIFV